MKKLLQKNKKKKAFSLPEALMVLLMIAICALLSTPLIIKKTQKKTYEVHGTYECIISGNKSTEIWRTNEGQVKKQNNTAECVFDPPSGALDFNVDICGNHAELENCNYTDGSHVLMYYPTLKKKMKTYMSNNRIYFSDYAFAFYRGGDARVLIVY